MNSLIIAHYPASFLPVIGGAELIVHNIAEEQANQGHDVYVFGTVKTANFFKKIDYTPKYKLLIIPKYIYIVGKILSPYSRFLMFLSKNFIMNVQKKYKFQIWHFNLISEYSLNFLKFLKNENHVCLGTFRGSDIQKLQKIGYGKRLNKKFEDMLNNHIGYFDHLTAISKSVYQEYLKLKVPQKKITLIPNFINQSRFDVGSFNKHKALKKFRLPKGKKIILTVGRNHPKKGYSLIPEMIKKLDDKGHDFLWVIIGKGCNVLVENIKSLNMLHRLRVIEEINVNKLNKNFLEVPSSELIEAYMCSDIFCFPTLIETFGNIFLEAMASKCPVVTTDAPGARDLIKNGYNGLTSPVNNQEEMIKNIELLLTDKKCREKIIEGGLETISNFRIVDIVNSYNDLYFKLSKEKND